jgi:hypothetical protein
MVKGTTSMGGYTKKKVHIRCRRCGTSDVEDVVKTHFTNVITNVQVVDSQRLNAESIPGLNGIHRC